MTASGRLWGHYRLDDGSHLRLLHAGLVAAGSPGAMTESVTPIHKTPSGPPAANSPRKIRPRHKALARNSTPPIIRPESHNKQQSPKTARIPAISARLYTT